MKKKYQKKIRRRMLIVGCGFSLILCIILGKAAHIQIWQGNDLTLKAEKDFKGSRVSLGKRGSVFDVHYREMAVTLDTHSIGAHPQQIKKRDAVARDLAKALGKNKKAVYRQLDTKHPFVWVKRQASPSEVTTVKALSLDGVVFKPAHSRFYPNQVLAGQVLGFTGVDGTGLEGVEFHYDTFLRGRTDRYTVLRDARGLGFDAEFSMIPDYTGQNIILTIDANIQFVAEQALKGAVDEFEAISGMAVVMNPKTGAVLAMAHYPFVDPNQFQEFKRDRWRNRIVTDAFEPGSTLKIFTAAAALESKSSSSQSIFYCENGTFRIGPNRIHDTHPRGWLTLKKIVKFSSNIGAAKVGQAMGKKTLYRTLEQFGFGSKTGIDCPGESPGRLVSYRHWKPIDAANIAFGQGVAVSAIQLTAAVAALANDGVLMRPYLVQAIADQDGRLLKNMTPKPGRKVVSTRTARTVRSMMAAVVEEGGTGVQAAMAHYSVGGKTGTAQKVEPTGGYSSKRFISSFVGLAPVEQPKAVVLVVLDEPRKKHYGGTVAAPAFRQIMRAALSYLDEAQPVPPKNAIQVSEMIRKVGT